MSWGSRPLPTALRSSKELLQLPGAPSSSGELPSPKLAQTHTAPPRPTRILRDPPRYRQLQPGTIRPARTRPGPPWPGQARPGTRRLAHIGLNPPTWTLLRLAPPRCPQMRSRAARLAHIRPYLPVLPLSAQTCQGVPRSAQLHADPRIPTHVFQDPLSLSWLQSIDNPQ